MWWSTSGTCFSVVDTHNLAPYKISKLMFGVTLHVHISCGRFVPHQILESSDLCLSQQTEIIVALSYCIATLAEFAASITWLSTWRYIVQHEEI